MKTLTDRKFRTLEHLLLIAGIGLIMGFFTTSCKTPKYACPAYNEYKHTALADSTDPSNSMKMYYYYLVVEEGGKDSMSTNATSIEGIEDDSKTNEEIMHETDLGKEKEEEWKPYGSFNIRMEVDSMGKPLSYKAVKYKGNGLSSKKKPKSINVDKELAEDKKKKEYTQAEDEASQSQ